MLNHIGSVQLETIRLILRRYESTDADDMYKNWVTDPDVCRFWQWKPHKNIDETKTLIASWIEEYHKPNYYHWVIAYKETAQAIGYIYLADIDEAENSVSVHYALSKKYWNKGIMTEVCRCVIDFCFDNLGVKKVYSNHHVENPASGRVQMKSGMRYIKTAYKRFDDCERLSGDYCFFEITAEDRLGKNET